MAKEGRRSKKNWRNRLRAFRRKRLHPIWQEIEWPLVGVIWVLSIVLGYIGFYRYSMFIGEDSTRFDLLYRAVQLIVFESGDVEDFVPWQLEVARFLVPAVAAYAAIQALLAIFSKQWQLLKVRFFRNHVVVCGLGERGLRLVQEFSEHGYRVVVIEEDEENAMIDQCRKQEGVVLIGNATDKNLLCKARVHRAKYLVSVCADDGTNAEIALKARDLVRSRKGQALTAFVHIVDLELCNLIRGLDLTAEADSFRLEFFNVLERGARLMLRVDSIFHKKTERGDRQPKMLIVGLGKMGRSLIVQAAREWWIKQSEKEKRLRITVIDNTAQSKVELLRLRYPQLDKVCEFDIRQMGKNAPEFERGDFLFNSEGHCNVDIIYICFDDDVHVLVNALTLYRKTKEYKVPIVVRMSQDAGLATLMKEGRNKLDFSQLHTFALLDKTCSLETLLGGTHELIARAIHEDYVRQQKRAGETMQTNPSMVDWDDLPEDLKESNRHQAAHIEVKLKAIGCDIQPLTDWEAVSFYFLMEEVEKLAEMEHERWCEERRRQGWTYASGKKNIKKKTSPHLVPWEKLSEEIKEYDRNMVRGLPSFLAQAGFQIYRRM